MKILIFSLGATLVAPSANAQNCTSVVTGNTIHTNCDRAQPVPQLNFDWMSDAVRTARERAEIDRLRAENERLRRERR